MEVLKHESNLTQGKDCSICNVSALDTNHMLEQRDVIDRLKFSNYLKEACNSKCTDCGKTLFLSNMFAQTRKDHLQQKTELKSHKIWKTFET